MRLGTVRVSANFDDTWLVTNRGLIDLANLDPIVIGDCLDARDLANLDPIVMSDCLDARDLCKKWETESTVLSLLVPFR